MRAPAPRRRVIGPAVALTLAAILAAGVAGPAFGTEAEGSAPARAAAPALPLVLGSFTVTRFCFLCGSDVPAGSVVTFVVTANSVLFGSPWTAYTGNVTLQSSDPQALLPPPYTFTGAGGDAGVHSFPVTFRTAGPQTLTVFETAAPDMVGTSDATNVVPGPAHHLTFSTQPTGAQAGSPLASQPKVMVQDAFGNRVPTTPAVSLGLVAPSGISASLACASGTTVGAIGGVAVFSGCTVDHPGNGFTLVASSTDLFAATSAPFDITPGPSPSPTASPSPSPSPPATAIVLTASPTTVTWPSATVLTVALAGAGPGRLVRVERRDAGSATWSHAGTISTDAFSAGTLEYIPNRTAEYRAVWPGDASLSAATSAAVPVVVRFQVIVSPSTTPRRTTVGKTLAWTATLRPVTAGVTVRFRVYKAVGRTWVLQATSTKTTSAAGKATFSRRFSSGGSYYVLATALAGPANASGSAPKKYVTVR